MKLSELTPEQKRIVIAKACGWESIWKDDRQNFRGFHLSHAADGKHRLIPDYLNDLNAMHEAEKVLNPYFDKSEYACEMNRYIRFLHEVCGGVANCFLHHCATAAQRADAFLLATGRAEL